MARERENDARAKSEQRSIGPSSSCVFLFAADSKKKLLSLLLKMWWLSAVVVCVETISARHYSRRCSGIHAYEWTLKTDLCFPTYLLVIVFHILAIWWRSCGHILTLGLNVYSLVRAYICKHIYNQLRMLLDTISRSQICTVVVHVVSFDVVTCSKVTRLGCNNRSALKGKKYNSLLCDSVSPSHGESVTLEEYREEVTYRYIYVLGVVCLYAVPQCIGTHSSTYCTILLPNRYYRVYRTNLVL